MNASEAYARLTDRVSPDLKDILQLRLPTGSSCDLFALVESPSGTPLLSASFSAVAVPESLTLPQFRGLNTKISSASGRVKFQIEARQVSYRDLFIALADDISQHLALPTDEALAAKAFAERLNRWQRFLERAGPEGLSAEKVRGLVGELLFLRQIVLPHIPHLDAVRTWQGPLGSAHDFHIPSRVGYVEIKTTTGSPPTQVIIHGARQLDGLGQPLWLVVFALERTEIGGDSLYGVITQLREVLAPEPNGLMLFEERLMEAGYSDTQADLYRAPNWVCLSIQVFEVRDGFPRLLESDLPVGIGGIAYSLDLVACAGFIRSLDTLQEAIDIENE